MSIPTTPAPGRDTTAALLLSAAAATAAGPIAAHDSIDSWRTQVQVAASEIASLALSPYGAIGQLVDDAETLRYVTATLHSVERDDHSNRGVVKYTADPPSRYGDGSETARTDRLENPAAQELAAALFEHGRQGRRVRLTLVNRDRDKSENGKGYKTVIAADLAG